MKDKLKKLWIWLRKEVLNKGMLVWLIIAEAIFWSPCIAGAILGAVVNSWYYTICGVYAAFWAGPFTPAIPLQIGLAYGLKKMAEGIKKLRHRKKEKKMTKKEQIEEMAKKVDELYNVLYTTNDVVGIQDQDRTEYCLRIQRAVEYKGNCDHEDIPSILKDYENLILSRLSVTTEREINAVKEFAEKLKEKFNGYEATYYNGHEEGFHDLQEEIDELLKEYEK